MEFAHDGAVQRFKLHRRGPRAESEKPWSTVKQRSASGASWSWTAGPFPSTVDREPDGHRELGVHWLAVQHARFPHPAGDGIQRERFQASIV